MDAADPAAGWAAVARALETSNAWAWLDQVEFVGGERDDSGAWQMTLRPRAASAGVARIATPERLDRLGTQATSVLGTRTRFSLAEATRGGHDPGHDPGTASAGRVSAAAGTLGSRVAAEAAEANQQRQEAMGRPLVRAVLSVFPDAVLVRASKREPAEVSNPEVDPSGAGDSDAGESG